MVPRMTRTLEHETGRVRRRVDAAAALTHLAGADFAKGRA